MIKDDANFEQLYKAAEAGRGEFLNTLKRGIPINVTRKVYHSFIPLSTTICIIY
jgi:hypothetical protein